VVSSGKLHKGPKLLLRARQRLGKYRIERRIANGSVAAVYQAFDTIHGVKVALKVPHAGAMDDYFLADFKREARLAPMLEHANILPIRDASYIEGHFVISMPLGKQSLADRMRNRLATSTALNFVDQALAAVAHAHHCKIIHCDIKPDNFVIFPNNHLKLGDFAFSKIVQRTLKPASGSGTVGYMAPEQAVGRPMFQSDVFSLGLVAYELFSGYLHDWPFDWPPAGIERVKKRLSPALVDWMSKAIQVNPVNRYSDAIAMHREFCRARRSNGKKRRTRAASSVDPSLWEAVRFKQFQRKYRKTLDTRYECSGCSGPVSEAMQACPWCGVEPPLQRFTTTYPAACPRCRRGTKLDWRYCAWCYGYGFEVETSRHYSDIRYEGHCANSSCRGPLMRFMRYCPWCRTKVKKPWKLSSGGQRCPSCRCGVDLDFWQHCPWCAKGLPQ
jgi:eukaryotic-like serine/threonine-protein kinase